MDEIKNILYGLFSADSIQPIVKLTISKPSCKAPKFKKMTAEILKEDTYKVTKYTDTQVFHESMSGEEMYGFLCDIMGNEYLQLNLWDAEQEHMLLVSKKGQASYKKKKGQSIAEIPSEHNKKKNYILAEGAEIEPLIDMGIFTKDGRVVASMYDKFKQINRFVEIVDDEFHNSKKETYNIIDFGCGKSYLTFIIYYYFTEVLKKQVNIIGLDLKAEVIEKCNTAAKKYGYSGLSFELGDINGYKAPFEVDMVVTLHACDTATDYALYNAVCWNAGAIFSVPCCQHELNSQVKASKLSLLTRYGIVKERFAALATDAIRADLLEYCGYRTQLLEFVDFDHTPKNILIRAVKKPGISKKIRQERLLEVERAMTEFNLEPTLYKLLKALEEKTNKQDA